MERIYSTSTTSSGEGRQGHVTSEDGVLDFDLAVPKEMGGAGGPLTNPEQLFAAGYSACFHSALKGIARLEKVDISASTVTVEIGMDKTDEGNFQLAATIKGDLVGIDQPMAEKLMARAHEMCPYSRATQGNISQTIEITLH